jgi:hypothetical protein
MNETFKSDCSENIKKQEKAIAEENQIKNNTEMKNQTLNNSILDSIVKNVQNDWQRLKASAEAKEIVKDIEEKEKKKPSMKDFCRSVGITDEEEITSCMLDEVRGQKIEPVRWEIFPIVSKKSKSNQKTINLLAAGETGKTLLSCEIITKYIHNKPLFDDERCYVDNSEGKGVLFLSREEGSDVRRTLECIELGMVEQGIITKEERCSSARCLIITASDTKFWEQDDNGHYWRLEKAIEVFNLGLVVLDSGSEYSSSMGAKNNSNDEMLNVYKPLLALGLNIIIINHTRKASDTKPTTADLIGASFQANESKMIIGVWSDGGSMLNIQVLKSNQLLREEKIKIYKVERWNGEVINPEDETRDQVRTLNFTLRDIVLDKTTTESKDEDKNKKLEQYQKTLAFASKRYQVLGQGSLIVIVKELNENKMTTLKGGVWTEKNLANVLPTYMDKQGLEKPKHNYKTYLANLSSQNQVSTVPKTAENTNNTIYTKNDTLKDSKEGGLMDEDRIWILDYVDRRNDYLYKDVEFKVIRKNDFITFQTPDNLIVQGYYANINIDYHYQKI